MSKLNRKAVISEDGSTIFFFYEGKKWEAMPSDMYPWRVEGPDEIHGEGCTIWEAVEDAISSRSRAIAATLKGMKKQ